MKMDIKIAVRQGDASVHAQLFDIEGQLRDMDRTGIDVAVQSCILGWDASPNAWFCNRLPTELQQQRSDSR